MSGVCKRKATASKGKRIRATRSKQLVEEEQEEEEEESDDV